MYIISPWSHAMDVFISIFYILYQFLPVLFIRAVMVFNNFSQVIMVISKSEFFLLNFIEQQKVYTENNMRIVRY
jgi:hypothetical protein